MISELLPADAKAWTTDDKSEWAPGPWTSEPDKVSWTDPDTGRPCLIHRNGSGSLCGYVAVDPGHPFHGKDYTETPFETVPHGDLTYAAPCRETDDESHGICHVPQPGAPDNVWWFGFDCAHAGDLSPRYRHIPDLPSFMNRDFAGRPTEYRDIDYVIRECQKLAKAVTAYE